MTSDTTTKTARTRILGTAARIFAEKGFDGARVDEIAKAASVPKSLIYYHFKSKEEIYEVLTQEFLDSYGQLIDQYREESSRYTQDDLAQRMQTVYYQFGMEHEAFVRTILMDSVKKGNTNTILYRMVSELIQSKEELTAADKERLIGEFFFSILPCMAYICLKESWSTYFQMQESEFNQTFLAEYSRIHSDYHKRMGGIKDESDNSYN